MAQRNNYYILYNNGYSCKNWSDKICINSFYEDKLSSINYCKFKTNHFYSEIRIHFILLGKRITCNIIYKKSKCFITSNAIKIAKEPLI